MIAPFPTFTPPGHQLTQNRRESFVLSAINESKEIKAPALFVAFLYRTSMAPMMALFLYHLCNYNHNGSSRGFGELVAVFVLLDDVLFKQEHVRNLHSSFICPSTFPNGCQMLRGVADVGHVLMPPPLSVRVDGRCVTRAG